VAPPRLTNHVPDIEPMPVVGSMSERWFDAPADHRAGRA